MQVAWVRFPARPICLFVSFQFLSVRPDQSRTWAWLGSSFLFSRKKRQLSWRTMPELNWLSLAGLFPYPGAHRNRTNIRDHRLSLVFYLHFHLCLWKGGRTSCWNSSIVVSSSPNYFRSLEPVFKSFRLTRRFAAVNVIMRSPPSKSRIRVKATTREFFTFPYVLPSGHCRCV